MKPKYVFFAIAVVLVLAVAYPVVYSAVANPNLINNPYFCTPLIPCQKPPAATTVCSTTCYIYMEYSTFIPAALNVTVGAHIIWLNRDGFSHYSISFNTTGWASPVIPPGHQYSINITSNMEMGYSYYYRCIIHTEMIGVLNVVANSSA